MPSHASPRILGGGGDRACRNIGFSGAPTVIDGAVVSGSLDGGQMPGNVLLAFKPKAKPALPSP